jgi:NADH-quinone oxidoreductase subunit J
MDTTVFVVGAVFALCGGFTVVFARNPVHSALGLVGTLFSIAVLFLLQGANLLAAVQVIVYAGAIVVLILFVLMLLGVDREDDLEIEPLPGQRELAGVVAALLGLGLLAVILLGGDDIVTGARSSTAAISETIPDVRQIGQELFTNYVFALEITAVLLTIAVVGAVVLARRPTDVEPLPELDPLDEEDDDRVYTAPEAGHDPEASR